MATLEVISSGSGVTESERLQNTATAANNNGAKLAFAANRTTSGLTDVAGVSGLITDITQSAYAGALTFSTADNAAPAERMRIDSVGNVGIGTNSPTGKLDVVGSVGTVSIADNGADLSFSRVGTNYIYATDAAGILALGAANIGNVLTIFDTGATASTLNLKNGRVGIGTVNPNAKFEVEGGAIGVYDSASTAGISITPVAGSAQRIFSDYHGGSEQPLQLGTYSSQTAVHIATSGSIGMGTTSPASRLDLAGGALTMQEMTAPSSPASNNCVIYAEDNGSGKTRLMVKFATGSAQQIAIEP